MDKLESIPGLTVSVAHDHMVEILDTVGCCIVGQTKALVPADKIMYATRDVTSTVDNEGLISCMYKMYLYTNLILYIVNLHIIKREHKLCKTYC